MRLGSRVALEEMYKRHFSYAVRLAEGIVGDTWWAEDLAAGAFARLWEKRGSVRDASAAKGYLVSTVRNMALSHIRDQRRLPVLRGIEDVVAEPGDVGRRFVEVERDRLLAEGMKRLTRHERQVLLLLVEGRTVKSIAQMRKTSRAAVHKVRSRGIGKLQRFVKYAM